MEGQATGDELRVLVEELSKRSLGPAVMAMANPLLPEAVGHTPPSSTTSLTPRQSSLEAAQPDARSRVPAPIPPAYVRQGSGLGGAVQVTQGEHRYRSGQFLAAIVDLFEDAKLWRHAHWGRNLAAARVRLHRRLVAIHPFRNGSGHHARRTRCRIAELGRDRRIHAGGERRSASSRIAVPIRGATTQGRSRSR